MLGHHLGSWRAFRRYPWLTALSVAVLTLGLTCFIAAALFARYLDGFDREFPHSDRIYTVYQSIDSPASGLKIPLTQTTALPVADQLRLDVPELAAVARSSLIISRVGAEGIEPRPVAVVYAEPDWARIFELRAVAGELDGALAKPATAVLTPATASKLFGAASPIGQIITLEIPGRRVEVTVAAVADVPAHSYIAESQFTIGAEIFCSWDVLAPGISPFARENWTFPSTSTFVLLPENGALTGRALDDRLQRMAERPLPDPNAKIGFETHPISRYVKDQLATRIQGFGVGGLPVDITAILLALGSLILGIACLNFVNLSTASSAGRGREIGVRKSLGATARAIVVEDLLRTAAMTCIAAALACALIYVAALPFDDHLRALVAIPASTPAFWLQIGVLLAAITIAAGLYPAFVLARANPVTALRGGTSKSGAPLLRWVLVGMQFASAAFLCLAVLVAYMQTRAVREAALGRFPDQYVVLGSALRGISRVDFDVLATELQRGPGVKSVAGIDSSPWQALGSLQAASRTPGPDGAKVPINTRSVTHDYFAVMDTPLLAGRWFSRQRADDALPSSREEAQRRTRPTPVVIDKRAAVDFGWPNPADAVGQLLYPANSPQQPVEVIGVVESQPLALRSRDSDAYAYMLAPNAAFVTLVRIESAQVEATLAHIDDVWGRMAPNVPVTRTFLDEAFERAYAAFDTLNRVALALASFAIAIAAVGLFGMAGFMTVRRTREIGLRKTQGATSRSILRLLLWDFAKPVLVANVAIWPLAYIAARAYLDLFVERMALTPMPFVATLAATVLLAWLVVGSYVVAAARLNPAIALRHE